MAPHSSTLAWKIPWMEEPGRLQSMGSRRVGHDWATSLSLFTFLHWRRKWQPTPVFLPGESQGRGSLLGCHLCGCTESDMTEVTSLIHISPSSQTYLPSPSPSYPLGYHKAPALGSLHLTINSHWLSVLHIVMYMFQCSSLKSFHPQKCISNYFWWGGFKADDGPSLHLSTCLSLDWLPGFTYKHSFPSHLPTSMSFH